MKCKICSQKSHNIFEAKILFKYDIEYFHCHNCGFLQTEEPYWLPEAYKEAINISDTGIMERNLMFSRLSSFIIFFFFEKEKKFLDFAGGHGFFTRLMRDIGFDFYWKDKYTTNLVARGFEFKEGFQDIELITTFETFEHFDKPIDEIENMLTYSKNILFSTDLLPNEIPTPENWYYYGLEHGQHISFYSLKTLKFIAKKYNLKLYTNNQNLHLLTEKKLDPFCFEVLAQSYRSRKKLFKYFIKSIFNKELDSKCYLTILKNLTQEELLNIIKSSIKSKVADDMSFVIEQLKKC